MVTNESRKDETPRHDSAVRQSPTRTRVQSLKNGAMLPPFGGDRQRKRAGACSRQVEQSEMTVRIWIRYRKGVTTKNRLTCTEKGMPVTIYDIKAVLPDADRTRLEIMCTGGLTSG